MTKQNFTVGDMVFVNAKIYRNVRPMGVVVRDHVSKLVLLLENKDV